MKGSLNTYNPNGPAVILGNAGSIFPRQLAAQWVARGLDVVIVTSNVTDDQSCPDGVRLVDSRDFRRPWMRWVRGVNPVLRWLERNVPRLLRRRYQRRTGREQPESWELFWVDHFWDSFSRARAAVSVHPRFVFGHEVCSYGLATVLCRGVPRILFPWGGDIYNAAECSPFIHAMVRYSLRHADLIVPSAIMAARHLSRRYGISADRVHAVSWGVDPSLFRRATSEERAEICCRYDIDPRSTIVLNVRRFQQLWGSRTALEAFLKLAAERADTHFVLFGGAGLEEEVHQAGTRIAEARLSQRFTLLEGNTPLMECAKLMSVADVFTSLMGRGDMRSASILQAMAAGGAPVIADLPEYREMERLGFAARFVSPADSTDTVAALRSLLDDPQRRQRMVEQNQRYIEEYEAADRQMDKLLQLIDSASLPYRAEWEKTHPVSNDSSP